MIPPVMVPSKERVGLESEFDCTAIVASSTCVGKLRVVMSDFNQWPNSIRVFQISKSRKSCL